MSEARSRGFRFGSLDILPSKRDVRTRGSILIVVSHI